MADKFKDVDLSRDSFDVGHIDDFLLDEDFDGDLFTCKRVCG